MAQSFVSFVSGFYQYALANRPALLRYGLVSLGGYSFAVLALFALTHVQWVDTRLSYALVYLFIYVFQYPITIFFIYRVQHKTSNLFKYALYLFLNWSLASTLFFVLSHFGLGIFQAFILVALIMFPLRFVYGKRVYQ